MTCTNTARIAIPRLGPPGASVEVIRAEKAFTPIPTIATAITPSPETGRGFRSRAAASIQMKTTSSQRKSPLSNAPRISARR